MDGIPCVLRLFATCSQHKLKSKTENENVEFSTDPGSLISQHSALQIHFLRTAP